MGEAKRKRAAGVQGQGWVERAVRIPRALEDAVRAKFGEDASRRHIYERALNEGLVAMLAREAEAESVLVRPSLGDVARVSTGRR